MATPNQAELALRGEIQQLQDRITELERERTQDLAERRQVEEQNRKLLDAVQEEKDRLSAVIASMSDEVWFADAQKRLVLVNPAAAREFHLDRVDQPEVEKVAASFEVFRPDGSPRPVEDAPPLRALNGELVKDEEEIVRTPDTGELRHREVSAAPVRDAAGNIVGSVCVVRDITKRKRAEAQTIQSQRTFSELVERAPFGIYVVDSQFRIAHMNASSQTGAFRNVRPVIGRDFSEAMRVLWPEPVAARIIAVFRHTLETGEPYYSPPFINPRHDVAAVESYEWELHRMTLPDGQNGVICYYFDSTKLREAEAARRESEERFRSVVENMSEGLLLFDAQGNFTYQNPASLRIHGFGTTEAGNVEKENLPATWKGWDDTGRPMSFEEWPISRVLRRERFQDQILRATRVETGQEFYASYNGCPIVDANGRLIFGFITIREITGQRKAEERLFETLQRLHALMEALPVGVSFSDDPTCQRVTGNPAVLAQFEAGTEDNLSASAPDPVAPGRQVRFFKEGREIGDAELPLQRAVKYGRATPPVELEVRLPSGRTWFTEASGAPVRDRQGNVVGGVAVTVDVTERKRSEERLRHAQKLESIGVLAGGIAHDFNNLLTAILGNTSLLQLEMPPGSAERFQAIIDASEKAAALTRQLLAYAGKGQFQIADFDVTRMVRSSADLVRVSIPKSIDLQLDVPRYLPAVRGDSSQIQQVLMNLVINAADATEGRAKGRVAISAGIQEVNAASAGLIGTGIAAGRYIFISVQDNGCGMDEHTKEKIFDPFFTTKFTGRGLGLAAVQGILRAHKGTITVDSKPGQGSNFTVYLPCSEREAAASSREDIAKAGGRAATVLIVDDEEFIRVLTKAALEKRGHRVLFAQNGRQALELLGNHADIDLVVLDIIMPVLGGVEAFSEMRKRWPQLAVLIASGYSRYEAVKLGIPDDLPFLAKPYTVQALAAAVEKALQPRPSVGA